MLKLEGFSKQDCHVTLNVHNFTFLIVNRWILSLLIMIAIMVLKTLKYYALTALKENMILKHDLIKPNSNSKPS